jgi:FKBP-type peptidyl-prolyl cis-trans isomerase FkpA
MTRRQRLSAIAASAGCALLLLAGCSRQELPAATAADQVAGMQVTELVVGQGPEAARDAKVTVHYTGWLYDHAAADGKGREFDSSRNGGRPFSFQIGHGQVIAGWDRGVAGMRAGGQRRLVIPADLAYGDQGAGGVIPPGATLVFDVELLAIEPAAP